MSNRKKGNPIPVKFDPPEEDLIFDINEQTGMPQVEIIRRAMRLLRMEIERRRSRTFLFEELGPKQSPAADIKLKLLVAEEPPPTPLKHVSYNDQSQVKATRVQEKPTAKARSKAKKHRVVPRS